MATEEIYRETKVKFRLNWKDVDKHYIDDDMVKIGNEEFMSSVIQFPVIKNPEFKP